MRITRQRKMPHMSDKPCFMQYKYMRLANRRLASDRWCSWMWGVAAIDSLKSTCMTLLGVEGEPVCAATVPGEPAPAQHTAGRCSEIPRDLNSVPEDKWERKAALSAAGKTKPGLSERKSHRAPPPRVVHFFVMRHATSRVTLCHAKMKP